MTTLKVLAKKAGCSKNTVSLVLRDKGRISEDMRSKIKQLASDLGYLPNFAARSLVTGQTGFVGIFIPIQYYDYVRIEMVKLLLEELHNNQFKPILGLEESTTDIWYNSSWLRTFHEINVDAIILCTNPAEMPKFLAKTPIISLGMQPNTALPEWDSVALDRREAGAIAAQHILKKGHRKILAVTADTGPFRESVASVLHSFPGVTSDFFHIFTDKNPLPNPKAIYDYMQYSTGGPTAAIFSDAITAAQFATECMNHGMTLPKDLSIIAYDYLPNVESYPTPLTLVEQPIREVITATKELLLRRIAQPAAEYQQITLHHKLIERKSTFAHTYPIENLL